MEKTYNDLKAAIAANAEQTETALKAFSAGEDKDFGVVLKAQRYSLLGGGKRVRPFLVNECCKLLGGEVSKSMPLACALEMVHTYSLIHDDLPCMDDDDFRRGKPSCHKEFGYANALLAGDALLTAAFGTIAAAEELDAATRTEAVKILSDAAGAYGMIGGQVIDLEGEMRQIEFCTLLRLHTLKTAALMECAVRLGALAAGYPTGTHAAESLAEYARNVGIAFQVVDDVLDVTANEQMLGKPTGSDKEQNKTTFLTYYTVEKAMEYAGQLTSEAISSISAIEGSQLLCDFACYLLERKN